MKKLRIMMGVLALLLLAALLWSPGEAAAPGIVAQPPASKPVPEPEPDPVPPPPEPPAPIGRIPILMYHVIGDGSGSLAELYVNADTFTRQMEYLHKEGYHAVTLKDLADHWEKGTPLPPRPIVITFDDGYRTDYEAAFPVLRNYGFPAVHFLYAKKLNTVNSLSKDEIAELLAAGHEIGNHTYSHIELPSLGAARLEKETALAKETLEQELQTTVTSFCYPVGRHDEAAVAAVAQAGHRLAVTTAYGYAAPEQGLHTLKRIRINRSDGLQGFITKLKAYEKDN